jgi:anti-sigma regulatory factor (Ser/Thr protein kinase)
MAMSTKTRVEPGFRLVMPSRAENVAVVRQAVGGAIDVLELDESRLLDINAAVSEACNNVVIHAYEGREGPMRVQLQIEPDQLEVIVSDDGVGIRPGPPHEELEIQGLGLSVIQTLTDRTEFLGGVSQGTEVRMAFALDARPPTAIDETAADQVEVGHPPGEVSVAVSAGPLAAPVLGRVIAMLAARAGFSLEGISEAQLITDAVAARARGIVLGHLIQLGIDRSEGELEVRVGPLRAGGATELVDSSALGDLPPLLERLTRRHRVERSEDGELLSLTLENPA